jgi:hypothetical protein
MIRNTLLLLILIGLLASCSIDEKTTFNSDFSGKTTTRMDMTMMVAMISSMDSTGNGKANFYNGFVKALDSMKNVKNRPDKFNMTFDTTSNILSVGYDFKNLDDMNEIGKKLQENQAQATMSESTPKAKYYWKKKGKILVMPGMSELGDMDGLMGGKNDMGKSLSSIGFMIERTFPKKISKVSDDRIIISADKKTMTFKGTLADLETKPLKEITVTFK